MTPVSFFQMLFLFILNDFSMGKVHLNLQLELLLVLWVE